MKVLDKLRARYPALYRELGNFECGEGWVGLLDDLSAKLEPLARRGLFAVQVKEKFGGLRFYMSGSDPEMDRHIDEAETRSFVTCEKCGAEGTRRTKNYWVKTLCEDCA